MKRIICILLIIFWAMSSAFANSDTTPGSPDNGLDGYYCKTVSPGPDFLHTKHGNVTQSANGPHIVRIFIHIMRKSDGSGGRTSADVATALNNIQAAFSPHNICFSLVGIDEILNTNQYNINDPSFFDSDANGDGKFDNFSPNSHSNAIDIYLFDATKVDGGVAAKVPSTALAIGGKIQGEDLVTSQSLSHELGHCLGLFHTFHGSSCEARPGTCTELVNGSNATTCGDFVTDTPADNAKIFNCQNSSTCAWNGCTCNGSSFDANGARYAPNVNLIMAYTLPHCAQYFTNGQGARMRSTITQNTLLQAVTVPDNLTLSNLSISNQRLYGNLIWIVANTNVDTQSGSNVTFRAERDIVLGNGFSSLQGSTFRAHIRSICYTDINDANLARYADNIEEQAQPDTRFTGSFSVYPNPASSTITCVIPQSYQERGELSVYSTIGQEIEGSYIQRDLLKGENRVEIDCSKWQSGVYYIVVKTESRVMTLSITIIR